MNHRRYNSIRAWTNRGISGAQLKKTPKIQLKCQTEWPWLRSVARSLGSFTHATSWSVALHTGGNRSKVFINEKVVAARIESSSARLASARLASPRLELNCVHQVRTGAVLVRRRRSYSPPRRRRVPVPA